MRPRFLALALLASAGCSGSDDGPNGSGADEPGVSDSMTDPLPLMGGAGSGGAAANSADVTPANEAPAPSGSAASPYVVFVDAATGFQTHEVHDADREIVFFEATEGAMVSAASGDRVAGWMAAGADLDWTRSGVAFRVRFGTEAGERRAYFTEAGPGTICDLTVAGPDVLFISATNERPPNP